MCFCLFLPLFGTHLVCLFIPWLHLEFIFQYCLLIFSFSLYFCFVSQGRERQSLLVRQAPEPTEISA